MPGMHTDDHDPEETAASGELRRVTSAFIARLDDEGRAFFQCRFVCGMTQQATAAEMHATRARIKLLEKAQRQLFLDELRSAGYFVGYNPKPRWTRKAA